MRHFPLTRLFTHHSDVVSHADIKKGRAVQNGQYLRNPSESGAIGHMPRRTSYKKSDLLMHSCPKYFIGFHDSLISGYIVVALVVGRVVMWPC